MRGPVNPGLAAIVGAEHESVCTHGETGVFISEPDIKQWFPGTHFLISLRVLQGKPHTVECPLEIRFLVVRSVCYFLLQLLDLLLQRRNDQIGSTRAIQLLLPGLATIRSVQNDGAMAHGPTVLCSREVNAGQGR